MQSTFTASNTSPRVTSPARRALRAAQRRNRDLTESRIASKIERANSLLEGMGGWEGDIYAMLDRYSSWQADVGGQQFAGLGYGGYASTLNDRRYGKDFPIYQTEVDLQVLRFASRLLLATNGYAQGMLEGITSYVVGDGFTQEVKERQGKDGSVPAEILDKLNGVLDDFRLRNDWHGGEQPGLEEELFQRGEEDGEALGCLYEDDAGCTWTNTIEPEQLTAPTGGDMAWLFGVKAHPNNQRAVAYWLRGMQTDQAGEEYDAEQIVHYKNNVKRQMKRGIPSFSFGVADTLQLADNLRKALGTGAGIQAAIAGVRQWETATASQVQSFQQGFADYTATNASTGQTVPVKRYGAGGIEDVPKGMTWVNPPNASNAPAHIQILQACLRGATARWNAPEWIGSGDASNNNFASALVADAPFTKRVIRTQKRQEMMQKRIFTWALETRCRRQGVITATRANGDVVSMPWEELRKLVEVVVTAPSPEVRNKLEEAQANQIRVTGGWKSPQTVQADEGLDSARETANILEWKEEMGTAGPSLPMPGGIDGGGNPPVPAGGGDGELKGGGSGKVQESRSVAVRDASGVVHLLELASDSGFTGTTANGHKYVNGKQVPKDDNTKPTGKGSEKPHEESAKEALDAIQNGETEIADQVKEGGPFHEASVKIAAKVVNIVKSLINSEAPVWACETCDLWMFENAINSQHDKGVMAVKVAAVTACKSYMLARGLWDKIKGKQSLKESLESGNEYDLHEVTKQIHEAMQEIGLVAGFKPPSVPELRDALRKRAGTAIKESVELVRLAESLPAPIVNVPAPVVNIAPQDNSEFARMMADVFRELPKVIAGAVAAVLEKHERPAGKRSITIEKDADGRWQGEVE